MVQPKTVQHTAEPLYGILATQKSNILGQRRLVKAYHSRFINRRALGPRLPPELVDQIAEAVTDLVYVDVLDYWRTSRGRESIFGIPAAEGTAAEKAAAEELSLMSGGILCSKVVLDRTVHAESAYVHISASKNRPDLTEVVPGAAPATGPTLYYAEGALEVRCSPGTNFTISSERVNVLTGFGRSGLRAGRLVQVDGIEEAIKRWDQGVVDRYVKLLGLKVVSINGEDLGGMIPRLRLLQTVEWG